MNRQFRFNRFLWTILLSWLSAGILPGQGIDIGSTGSAGRAYIGVSVAPSRTGINNTFSTDLGKTETINNISVSGTFEAGYYFSRTIGISTGIGYGSYSSDLTLDNYSALFTATDGDNDNYQRHILGTDLFESQKIGFLHIPILINLQWFISQKIGMEIRSGVDINVPLNKNYSSEGVFSYSGFYPQYNITFADIPYEDFINDVNNKAEDDLQLKSITPGLVFSGNFFIMLNSKMMLSAGACFNKTLSDISGYDSEENFILSSRPSEINSLMAASNKVTAQAFGLSFGIRYYLK